MPRRTGHVAIQNANEPLRRVLRETGETQLDGVAAYAQVTVEAATGEIKVQRVVVAHDCGLVINPDGLRNQIEGNVVQGVSRALKEEVQFDARGRDERRVGASEPAIGIIPAAVGNAVFAAVGVRVRTVPMTPDRVLDANAESVSAGECPTQSQFLSRKIT